MAESSSRSDVASLIERIEAKGLCYFCDWDGDDYGVKEPSAARDLILAALRAYAVSERGTLPEWLQNELRGFERLPDEMNWTLSAEAVRWLLTARAPVSTTGSSPDTERMDWLERFHVEARTPLVHGSRHLFYANPEEVEGAEDKPSDIRAQIDYQRNGGMSKRNEHPAVTLRNMKGN